MGLFSSMRKFWYFNRCFSTAEQNSHTFSETCLRVLWLTLGTHFTSDSCPNLVTHHFSGWLQPIFQRKWKSLLETCNKTPTAQQGKTFTAVLWLLSSLSFSWDANKSCSLLRLLLLSSVPASHTQPLRGVDLFSCCGCRRQIPGRQSRCWDPSQLHRWANEQPGSGPIPALPMLKPALVAGKGKAGSSSSAVLVIPAEKHFCLPAPTGNSCRNTLAASCCSERELPHKCFPVLPHCSDIHSVRLSWLAARSRTHSRALGTGLSHTPLCSSGTSLAAKTGCFTGGFIGGLERMPSSCTGECALPSPPLTVTCSPVPALPHRVDPKLPKPTNKLNLIMRCLNALTHSYMQKQLLLIETDAPFL